MRRLRELFNRLSLLGARLRDESGQAMVEYSMTFFLLLGVAGTLAMTSVPRTMFENLQRYIDFFYFCLNLAVG